MGDTRKQKGLVQGSSPSARVSRQSSDQIWEESVYGWCSLQPRRAERFSGHSWGVGNMSCDWVQRPGQKHSTGLMLWLLGSWPSRQRNKATMSCHPVNPFNLVLGCRAHYLQNQEQVQNHSFPWTKGVLYNWSQLVHRENHAEVWGHHYQEGKTKKAAELLQLTPSQHITATTLMAAREAVVVTTGNSQS